jgi:rifampicin phosphotransferase
MDHWMVETELSDRFPFYTRANVGEVFPDPVVPLTFSFGFNGPGGLGGAELGFRDAYFRIGVMEPSELPAEENVFLGVVGGYAYLNASALRLLGHRAPGMTAKDIDDSFFGDAPGVPPFEARPEDDRPDLTAKVGETFGWVLTTPDLPEVREQERLVNRIRADRPDLASLSDRELLDHAWSLLEAHFRDLFAEHIFISFLATLPIGIISKVCEAVGQPTATLRLLAGLGDVESAAPSMAMWDLGRQVEASPALSAAFDGGHAGLDERLRAAAGDDASVARFVADFDEFLVRYGSRGPNEWEARSPTWETEPDLALAAIDRMRVSPESAAPRAHNEERAAERRQLGDAITAALAADPETQGQFAAALHAATVFMPGRERTKTNCIKLIQEARVALREWGRRMVEGGHFQVVQSYGMLTKEEQYAALDDTGGLHDELERREALYGEVSTLQEPFLFVGHPGAMTDYPRRDAVTVHRLGAGDHLQGLPGCPGKATGRARVILDSHDPTALEPGDILVAPITDPSWTPLFVPAGAVVVDVGAPLSHAIIVSRELGIPCVVSATDATKKIPDGALIEVDGDTGPVVILEA